MNCNQIIHIYIYHLIISSNLISPHLIISLNHYWTIIESSLNRHWIIIESPLNSLWPSSALSGSPWHPHGSLWRSLALPGSPWLSSALPGSLWLSLALPWHPTVPSSSCLALMQTIYCNPKVVYRCSSKLSIARHYRNTPYMLNMFTAFVHLLLFPYAIYYPPIRFITFLNGWLLSYIVY